MNQAKFLYCLIICLMCGSICGQTLLEVEGALRIESCLDTMPAPGTIRWSGTDFEGWNGATWSSLTGNAEVGSVTDIDGNEYGTIRIGDQVWMRENLRVATYNDGIAIDHVVPNSSWDNLSTGAWCWYDNDSSNEVPFGKLYNAFTLSAGKLCPTGWHVPSEAEWNILTDDLGGHNMAGGKMKEEGLTIWSQPNTGATNESGFTGVPGGARGLGSFAHIFEESWLWSSTESGSNYVLLRLFHDDRSTSFFTTFPRLGLSVRCLRD